MSQRERTAGGVTGRILGKVREFAGEAMGRPDVAREGRLQAAQGDAESKPQGNAESEAGRAEAAARRAEHEASLRARAQETEVERERLEKAVRSQQRDSRAKEERKA
jgi:uncharacterized protein YjbJ (UPF0337 family)